MKKHLFLLASLVLGSMLTSCQNDLEEVLDVNDSLATTRSLDENPISNDEDLLTRSGINLDISGFYIISGTGSQTYTATGYNLNNYNISWDYDHSVLQAVGTPGTSITLKLKNSTSTADTYLSVSARSKTTGAIIDGANIDIGCNGPVAGDCSLRVVRSSDGVEVYPSSIGLRPNTFYYAYLSAPSGVSNMTFNWNFRNAELYSSYGFTAYFKTDYNGYALLTLTGKMPGSSVYKYILGATLYGGVGLSGAKDEEGLDDEDEIEE